MELGRPGTQRKLNFQDPDRLKRVIGDEKNENLLGSSCQRCLPHSEELALDVLAGCGHRIGSQ